MEGSTKARTNPDSGDGEPEEAVGEDGFRRIRGPESVQRHAPDKVSFGRDWGEGLNINRVTQPIG